MLTQNASTEDSATSQDSVDPSEVDNFGVPLVAFGDGMPPQFFEILGRLVAVNGKIEYLMGRLNQLPSSETRGLRKVEQFLKRYNLGRMDRNAIVHSFWTVGTHEDPEVIMGFRYKVGKSASGELAMVSIGDVPDSEKVQVVVQYSLTKLRKLLRRDLLTMQVGELAFTAVSLDWATRQTLPGDQEWSTP